MQKQLWVISVVTEGGTPGGLVGVDNGDGVMDEVGGGGGVVARCWVGGIGGRV